MIAAGVFAVNGPGATMVTVGADDTVTSTVAVAVPLAVALTVALDCVVSVTLATPVASDIAVVELNEPVDDEKTTDTPGNGLFDGSNTSAEIVTVPPLCETLGGVALTETPPAAAAPILTSMPPPLLLPEAVLAPPEYALIRVVPEIAPARNVDIAMPFWVVDSCGLNWPSELEKMTCVPL